MKTLIVSPLSRAIFDSDLIATRLTLAMAELCWALMLFWPGETFDRPTYTVMAHVMSEPAWAAVFALSSVTQFAIVLRNEFDSAGARIFSMWNAALWVFSVGSMLLSVYPPPAAVGGELSLMVAALWVWARPLILEKGARRHATT